MLRLRSQASSQLMTAPCDSHWRLPLRRLATAAKLPDPSAKHALAQESLGELLRAGKGLAAHVE
jgi:hypothetical protein